MQYEAKGAQIWRMGVCIHPSDKGSSRGGGGVRGEGGREGGEKKGGHNLACGHNSE